MRTLRLRVNTALMQVSQDSSQGHRLTTHSVPPQRTGQQGVRRVALALCGATSGHMTTDNTKPLLRMRLAVRYHSRHMVLILDSPCACAKMGQSSAVRLHGVV